MKNPNPNFHICEILEHKLNEIIDKINRIHDAIGADPLDSQLRILDWIFYQVCNNEIKRIEGDNIEQKDKWNDIFLTSHYKHNFSQCISARLHKLFSHQQVNPEQ